MQHECIVLKIVFAIVIYLIVCTTIIVEECDFEDAILNLIKSTKFFVVFFSALLFLQIIVPSPDTMMKILIAKEVTYSRAEQTIQIVQDVYEDIMNVLDKGSVE